jgi:hypothetical protein
MTPLAQRLYPPRVACRLTLLVSIAFAALAGLAVPASAATERARIAWDTAGTDIDLHIWDDDGNHAWFDDTAGISDATLSEDIVDGPGEEFLTDDEDPSARRFTYGICYYGGSRGSSLPPTTVTLRLTDPGGASRDFSHVLTEPGEAFLFGSSPAGATFTPPDDWCRANTTRPAPENTVAPSVQGVSTLGASLTCAAGEWTNLPNGYAYQWRRSGDAVPGAIASSYAVSAEDVGREVACQVTAANAGGENDATSGPAQIGDSDGDALPDDWELTGIGPGAELDQMGADPLRKDVFVQLDSMRDRRLSDAALRIVVDAYGAAPVGNPNGRPGIALHIDNGPGSIVDPISGTRWGALSDANDRVPFTDQLGKNRTKLFGLMSTGEYDWTAFDVIKRAGFPSARAAVFHYALSANRFEKDGSSGISRNGSDIAGGASDFLITLGDPCGTTVVCNRKVAGTFMHELGHNLGLGHGGTDNVNGKPNYLSIMNYTFQFGGIPGVGIDYSRARLARLDERNLDERAGLGALPEVYRNARTMWWCGKEMKQGPAGGGLDWNCNRSTSDASVNSDISGDEGTELEPAEDWSRIAFRGGTLGLGATPPPAMTTFAEPTEQALIRPLQAQQGDSAKPSVRVKTRRGKRKGKTPGRVTLTLSASDNKSLDSVVLYLDGRRKNLTGRGKRRLTSRVVLKRGKTKVKAYASDSALNRSRTLRATVRG